MILPSLLNAAANSARGMPVALHCCLERLGFRCCQADAADFLAVGELPDTDRLVGGHGDRVLLPSGKNAAKQITASCRQPTGAKANQGIRRQWVGILVFSGALVWCHFLL